MVQRKSNPVPAIPGTYSIDTSSTMTFVTQLNDSGQLLYDLKLSTTQGASPAALANDQALMVFSPGAGSQVIVREGDVAPGTGPTVVYARRDVTTDPAHPVLIIEQIVNLPAA
jgi:hypothetical protein